MYIQRVHLREIHLPLVEPFQISSGTETVRRITLLEVTDGDGVTAWGECVAGARPNYNEEAVDTAWVALREWVIPRVLGQAFAGPEAVGPLLEANFRGHRMAKAGVEMAIWALEAEHRGVSLSRLIGGTRDAIATGISIGIQATPEALVEKVGRYLAEGYRKIKMKVKPGADVAYVRAVREAFGEEAPLMVDANNAYALGDLDTFRALDTLGLMMIEQPLDWEDLVRHAELQKYLATPLCLDESITSLARAEDMLALGSGRIVNIKPGRVGGLAAARAVHDYCERNGVPVWCGGMLESGIGRAYNVALASLSNFSLPGDVSPSRRYWAEDIVTPAWTMDGQGMVAVPVDRPGIGVRVKKDRIENLTVRDHVAEAR